MRYALPLLLLLSISACAPPAAVAPIATTEAQAAQARIETLQAQPSLTDSERIELAQLTAEQAERKAEAAQQQADRAWHHASGLTVLLLASVAASAVIAIIASMPRD